jgi:hypothetical protein
LLATATQPIQKANKALFATTSNTFDPLRHHRRASLCGHLEGL